MAVAPPAREALPAEAAHGMLGELAADFADYKHRRGMGWLRALASLRLTVVLFALAIFLVFAGTMAQTKYDIWVVVRDYFRTGIAWIEWQVFFPKSFFPRMGEVPGKFPFPGGWLIGVAMALNLLAAHAVRFRAQARGARLWAGLGVIALGMLTTWLVIAGGSGNGLQGQPLLSWDALWMLVKLSLGASCVAGIWVYGRLDATRVNERRLLLGATCGLATLTGWLFVSGSSATLGDSSMRILWQLIQGTLAGAVLLAGCWLVFAKRAGIVLLHAGIGLMMFNELFVGKTAVEGQMHIKEGDTVSYAVDIREVELAVIDDSDATVDSVVAIPQSLLQHGDGVIRDPRLPFDIKVVRYLQNSQPKFARDLPAGDKNPATAGVGLHVAAVEKEAAVGAGSSSVDDTAAYIRFLKKGSDESRGTYLLSLMQARLQESRERAGLSAREVAALRPPILATLDPFLFANMVPLSEPVTIEAEGKPYRVSLRFKRMYKPYSLTLEDVRTEYYPGSTTPRDYSSVVHLSEPSQNVDRDVRIWMNNPLRFAGETFYQSNVMQDPITYEEMTGLQVVTNAGWMIPYVACMIVAVGMLFQFGQTLTRFLHRRETASTSAIQSADRGGTPRLSTRDLPPRAGFVRETAERFFPLAIVLLCAAMIARDAMPPKPQTDKVDLYAAGKLPILAEGRAKPLDSLARNTLQIMSNKETLVGVMDAATLQGRWSEIESKLRKRWKQLEREDLSTFAAHPEQLDELAELVEQKTNEPRHEIDDFLYKATSQRLPAIRWLFDVISGSPLAERHRVFRIDNHEVLDLFGLVRREGFLYSSAEIRPKSEKFHEEADRAREKSADKGAGSLSVFERKLLEFDRRVRSFTAIDATFTRPKFPAEPTDKIREMARRRHDAILEELREAEDRLIAQGHPPLVVPVRSDEHGLARDGKFGYQWKPFVSAWMTDYFEAKMFGDRPADPAVAAWDTILASYKQGAASEFNEAVRSYNDLLSRETLPDLNPKKVAYEVYFNYFSPFFQAWILYIVGFALTALGWLGWSRPLNRAAFWLGLFTLALHSFALVSRIYISGRPPVTNLYSSAVFIGWGCVVLGLVLEVVFRLGIGNVISTIAGFAALFISFKLAGDGDTFTVMQAVLDTQFWLATHVTCITLGYATTFLAGLLGVLYILRGVLTPSLTPAVGKDLVRMIYGTLCFAIFFSFVGTVLGGLWADDSWGRFWGWDPKENGALIIVLWNALVLHARWGGLVKDRGLAALAVGGNIVTAWSWFGVNELGVGLHSYGFTEGVLLALGGFVVSQMAIIGIGMLPKAMWWSARA